MNEINIRHFYMFHECARLGSITAVSKSVGRSQPAVTQALQALETRIGGTLLRRGKTGVQLTRVGEFVAQRAFRVFIKMQSTISEISKCDKPQSVAIMKTLTNARLKALLAIAESDSLAAAARALDIAAPSLHRSARDLEHALDITLFETTSFGIRPTKSALKLADVAGQVFSEMRQARYDVVNSIGDGGGEIRIGAMPLARAYLAPIASSRFTEKHADFGVSLIEAPFEDLLQSLRRGSLDLLIGAGRGDAGGSIIEEPIVSDTLAILMRPDHPLARKTSLSKRDLLSFPWIAPRKSSPLHGQLQSLLGGAPPTPIECNSFSATRMILMKSDRLALLSDAQAKIELERGLLVSCKPPGRKLSRSIVLFYRNDWAPTVLQNSFLDTLRSVAVE